MAACSLQSYCERVPEANRWKLDKRIDFEHDGVPTHLGAIAAAMDEWEGRVDEALGLSKVDVSAIKTQHPDNLNLQTREALHGWQEKNGLEATYRNLIDVFLKAGKTSYAETVCKVLGMDSKLEVAMAELSTSDDVTTQQSSTGTQGVARKKSYGDEKKELKKKNLAKIKKSFARLKQQVLHILKEKDIDMDEFVEFVLGLVPNPECIQEDAEKIVTIFKEITRNLLWSYLDYELLKIIAQGFADKDTQQLIDHYEKELASFHATTRLVDYMDLCQDEDVLADPEEPLAPNPGKYNKEHFQKLTIKIGRRVTDETLQYAADLWKEVSKFFGLPSFTALLDCVLAGSLVISWIIPCLFAMQIRVNSTGGEAEAFYRSHQIIEVKLDDEYLYLSETTEDTTTKLALLTACEEGNSDEVLELVKRLSDLDKDYSQYDETPLTAAMYSNAPIDIIQVLLLYQFDVNGRNENGWTALMAASYDGRTDVVKLLIQHNADVNARAENGGTVLMMASFQGRTDVVELLIQHNADVNARMEHGFTAVMYATQKGNVESVRTLLEAGADPNITENETNWTPLFFASKDGREDLVTLLLEHEANVDHKDKNGITALVTAQTYNHTNIIDLLKASTSMETTVETLPPAELSEETRQQVRRAGDYNQKRFEKQMFFFKKITKITDYLLPGRARKREVTSKPTTTGISGEEITLPAI